MAVQTLNYLDIPANRRRTNAANTILRLREQLSDPMTSPEQADKIRERMATVQAWIDGTLPTT